LETFEGNSADLLRYCMTAWWERVGSTKASGISKLMMSEAGNFPELAAFYQEEVVKPGNDLIRRVLQRGVDSGEFRQLNVEYGVYLLLAPMMFLALWRHLHRTLRGGQWGTGPHCLLGHPYRQPAAGADSPHTCRTQRLMTL